jgi:hypothetical protein
MSANLIWEYCPSTVALALGEICIESSGDSRAEYRVLKRDESLAVDRACNVLMWNLFVP